MNENYNDCHHQKTTRTFLYTKKMWNVIKHKKPDTFQKARQFPLRLYIQKAIQFTLRGFSWNFWSWNLYTKRMTLFVSAFFIYKKLDTSQKPRQFAIRFIYKNPALCVKRFFIEFLKFAEGCEHLFIKKQCTLCDIFIL